MTEEKKPFEHELDETLSKAFDDIEASHSDDTEETASDDSIKTSDDVKKPELDKDDQKSASKVKDENSENTGQSVNEKGVVAAVSKAPDHWSDGAKAHWEKLDPVVRAEALKQEQFARKMQSQHAQERNKYAAIDAVLEPQRNLLRATYGDEANGLKTLFALSDFATKDPAGFIQYFAQQRGINLRGLQQNQTQNVDPTITTLQQQIAQLQQHIKSINETSQRSVEAEVDRSFKAFASNPDNKYIEELKEDMAFLIEGGRANDFQEAYNAAIKLNGHVSEMIGAEKRAKEEAERQKQAEEAANRAKKAKSLNAASSRGVSSFKPVSGNWMETVDALGDQLLGA